MPIAKMRRLADIFPKPDMADLAAERIARASSSVKVPANLVIVDSRQPRDLLGCQRHRPILPFLTKAPPKFLNVCRDAAVTVLRKGWLLRLKGKLYELPQLDGPRFAT